ncbi:MAG: class I SAM-dependent methyltransferase [Gammaproteobacteria bacterium]|nr:class I SAM-dependent methyltransferase [Gammaproteobacteria bacterium]
MRLPRDITLIVHFVLDELVPPWLRDRKWFMWLPFKLVFGDKAGLFFEFKERAPHMSPQQFEQTYRDTLSVHIERETDLNDACIAAIDESIVGASVLDIACGRGFLAVRLAKRYRVTAADIVVDAELARAHPQIRFRETRLEALPFADREFDTVVCTHTLEHVQDIQGAVRELRRVTARRLIVVVPKQRPYRYTFDLHLHFFPYASNLLMALEPRGRTASCRALGGDWFYVEDVGPES